MSLEKSTLIAYWDRVIILAVFVADLIGVLEADMERRKPDLALEA